MIKEASKNAGTVFVRQAQVWRSQTKNRSQGKFGKLMKLKDTVVSLLSVSGTTVPLSPDLNL